MHRLYAQNEIRHFLVWLAAYLVPSILLLNLGPAVGLSDHAILAVPLLVLSVVLFAYLRRTGIGTDVGLGVPAAVPAARLWFYLPLAVLVALPLAGGLRPDLTPLAVAAILVHFVSVGFLEEVLFRGMMLRALLRKWPPAAAVLLSAVIFGVGHAVGMLAGQGAGDTVLQVVNATLVGLVFTLVVVVTGSLTVVIVAHAAYNTIAALTGAQEGMALIGASLAVLVVYGSWLLFGAGALDRLRQGGTFPAQAAADRRGRVPRPRPAD